MQPSAPPHSQPQLLRGLCPVLLLVAFALPANDAGAALLKPDLKILDRGAIRLCQERLAALEERQACTGRGRTVLRQPSYIANIGAGPLEYVPASPRGDIPVDCHGDGPEITRTGVAVDNDVLVRQRLYRDRDHDGVFTRGVDTGSRSLTVGCRYHHPAHDHYHVESFARFELRSVSTGSTVRIGPKVSFCVGDRDPLDLTLPGAPQPSNDDGYYAFSDCEARLSRQGSSIGWYDRYGWRLAGQEIDVSGLPPGRFCLIARADPEDRIVETNEGNNELVRELFIDPARAPVGGDLKLSTRPGCPDAMPEPAKAVELIDGGLAPSVGAGAPLVHPVSGWPVGPSLVASPVQVMRPRLDLVSGWDVRGASLAWLALDDSPAGWDEPEGDAFLIPSAAGQVSEVGLGPLPPGWGPGATVWFYGKTGDPATQLQVDVRSGGATRATHTVPPSEPYAWRGVRLSPADSARALDDISLRFTAVGGTGAIVRAAWVGGDGW